MDLVKLLGHLTAGDYDKHITSYAGAVPAEVAGFATAQGALTTAQADFAANTGDRKKRVAFENAKKSVATVGPLAQEELAKEFAALEKAKEEAEKLFKANEKLLTDAPATAAFTEADRARHLRDLKAAHQIQENKFATHEATLVNHSETLAKAGHESKISGKGTSTDKTPTKTDAKTPVTYAKGDEAKIINGQATEAAAKMGVRTNADGKVFGSVDAWKKESNWFSRQYQAAKANFHIGDITKDAKSGELVVNKASRWVQGGRVVGGVGSIIVGGSGAKDIAQYVGFASPDIDDKGQEIAADAGKLVQGAVKLGAAGLGLYLTVTRGGAEKAAGMATLSK